MPFRVIAPDAFFERVQRLKAAAGDAAEVMPALEKLMWEDNRDGLLNWTDKNGRQMKKLSPHTIRYRKSAVGKADPKAPPLIPCWRRSRAIANYRLTSFQRGDGNWILLGAWVNVVSKQGVPFLGFHATGTRNMPRRDIFGVRPEGRKRISAALKAWLLAKWGLS